MPTLTLSLQISSTINVDTDTMISNIIDLYDKEAGITVQVETDTVNGMPNSVAVGGCDLDDPVLTSAQVNLFNNFGNGLSSDVVALFVGQITATGPALLGCSVHPLHPLKLRSIISSNASEWVLAHEVAHNLGLKHSASNSNLMFHKPQQLVEPVTLTDGQAATMVDFLEHVHNDFAAPAFLFAAERRALEEAPITEALRPVRSADYSVVPLLHELEEQVKKGTDQPDSKPIYLAAEIPLVARGDSIEATLAALRVLWAASNESQPVIYREAVATTAWRLGAHCQEGEAAWQLASLIATLKHDDSRRVRRAASISAETLRLGYAALATAPAHERSPNDTLTNNISNNEIPLPDRQVGRKGSKRAK